MSRFTVSVEGRSFEVEFKSRVGSLITFVVAGEEYRVEVAPTTGAAPSHKSARSARAPSQSTSSDLKAPMPGIISDVIAAPGTSVKAGDVLVVIEAMKMENPIKAASDGVIDQVLVQKGQEVATGAVLVTWQK